MRQHWVNVKQRIKGCFATLFFRWTPRFSRLSGHPYGVNLVGYARAEMGLGEALRNTAMALDFSGVPFLVREIELPLLNRQENVSMQPFMADDCFYGINCIGINPDLLYRLPFWLPYDEWGRRYNVGYWFWELSKFPDAWRYACNLVDEVWVNTEFVANAVRQVHERVYKIPFAISFDKPCDKYDRAYFGLPASGFLFLVSYDFNSSATRKNPDAVIEAFRSAFAVRSDNSYLVVKSINGNMNEAAVASLKSTLGDDSRIVWVDEYLTTDEMRGLLNVADAYVSLHRAEGLGLGMAESMYLGKPVIATDYSGNVEFMNADNACMVPYELVPVNPGEYPHHEGQHWANPDVAVAAEWMQRLAFEPAFAAAVGERAAAYMGKHHSKEAMSAAIRDRVSQIYGRGLE